MANGEWARLINTTTSNYIRDVEVNILRNRKLLAMLQSKGRVKYNQSGKDMDWKIEYRRAALNAFEDGDTLTFAKQDRWKTATLPWRAYYASDSLSEMESLMNRGTPAIVQYYNDVLKFLTNDIEENFGDQLYIDGNATGNNKKLHGIESFLGAGASAANGFMTPSDTYAGLSTIPGSAGGNWTGTWPAGKGDPHYDFWSPILVNVSDAAAGVYAATTRTWPNTCIQALRFGITKTKKAKSATGMLDMIVLEETLYDQFKDAYEPAVEIQVQRGQGQGLLSLGFTDFINFDGVDVTTEFGMPASTGYGFNTMHMELDSLHSQLFKSDGPNWSEETASWRYAIKFYGNARFNPRNMMKLYPYS